MIDRRRGRARLATVGIGCALMMVCSGCAGYLRPDPAAAPPERGGIEINEAGAAAFTVIGCAMQFVPWACLGGGGCGGGGFQVKR